MSSQSGSQAVSSQSVSRLHPAGGGGPRLSPGPRYSRASLGSLGRAQRGLAQCQALSLHHWCRMCCRQAGRGPQNACWTSTHLPLTTPAKITFSCSFSQRLHLYWTLPPSFLFSLPLLAPSILELLWFRSLSFPSSILPAPAVLQPTTVSYWFIDCCLPVGERPQSPSLPLLLPCMDLFSLSTPFFSPLSPQPLHLPIDAAALKHELEKAGESNLPGGIRFTFSCVRFFFALLHSFASMFWGLFCVSDRHLFSIFTVLL